MATRRMSVAIASFCGSFVVYGAHVACGGGFVPRGAAQGSGSGSAAASPSASASASAVAGAMSAGECTCVSALPRTVASFAIGGDEKIVLDPIDASARLDVAFARGATGKKLASVTIVVRAYRTDQPSARATTLAIRAIVQETGGSVASKDIEAYLTIGSLRLDLPPRAFATVDKSALTVSLSDEVIEVRGSLTLKDVPTGKSLVVDKLSVRKTGPAILPVRTGALVAL